MSDLDPNVQGMCTECKSQIPTNKMAKSGFAQSGMNPPCPYCGGVVAVVDVRQGIRNIATKMDRERGL